MNRVTFGEQLIASAGYNPIDAVMELEFTRTGKICKFSGVTEDVWYGLKFSESPDRFFQTNIRGRFREL